MITKVTTIEDVKHFAKQLISEGLSFHPDDDFKEYVNLESNLDSYNSEEAKLRNQLMSECFQVCESLNVDIYEIMLEELLRNQDLSE